MRVFVYGTLKEGYGNCNWTGLANKTKIGEEVLPGYKLLNSGFPVAIPSENDAIHGEVWDIGDDKEVLGNLDRLESNGSMYHRTHLKDKDFSLYVGDEDFWADLIRKGEQGECPRNEEGVYVWTR